MSHFFMQYINFGLHVDSDGSLPLTLQRIKLYTTFLVHSNYIGDVQAFAFPFRDVFFKTVVVLIPAYRGACPFCNHNGEAVFINALE